MSTLPRPRAGKLRRHNGDRSRSPARQAASYGVPDDGEGADEETNRPVRPEGGRDRHPDRYKPERPRHGHCPRAPGTAIARAGLAARKRAVAGGPIIRRSDHEAEHKQGTYYR
jgi:hypothetical protein